MLKLRPRTLLICAGVVAGAVVGGTAQAATIPVSCSSTALVAAVSTANSSPGADTLSLADGCTYTLTSPNNGLSGLPVVTSAITIEGHGATIRRDSSAPSFRILYVDTGGALTLNKVTIGGGRATDCPNGLPFEDACGGGIESHGTLTVNQSRVTGNTATSTAGGGIFVEGGGIESFGTATISRSDVSSNTAAYAGTTPQSAAFGGGIGNEGSLTIDQSTLVGNVVSSQGSPGEIGDGGFAEGSALASFGPASISGSAIRNNASIVPDSGSLRGALLNGDTMTVSSTDITDNTSSTQNGEAFGGGIRTAAFSTLTVTNATIARNRLDVSGGQAVGGGIDVNLGASVTIGNTVISGNTARSVGGVAAGGGLRNRGTTDLTRVTVNGNTASGDTALGGGIRNSPGSGPLTLTRGSVTTNTAAGAFAAGGGISNGNGSGSVTLNQTTVENNVPDNCNPSIGSCS